MQRVIVTLETGKIETIAYRTPASVVLSLESEATDLHGTMGDAAAGGVSEGRGAAVSGSPRLTRTVAAKVNNEIVGLDFKVEVNATVLPVRLGTPDGERVFRQSLCFLLTVVAKQLFQKRRIVIGHSLGDGYYYYFDGIDRVSEVDTEAMSDRSACAVLRGCSYVPHRRKRGLRAFTPATSKPVQGPNPRVCECKLSRYFARPSGHINRSPHAVRGSDPRGRIPSTVPADRSARHDQAVCRPADRLLGI